jgi:hypothetical protein
MRRNVKRGLLATSIALFVTIVAYVPVDALWKATCGEASIGPNGVNADPAVGPVLLDCLPIPRVSFLALIFSVTLIVLVAAISLRAGEASANERRRLGGLAVVTLAIGVVAIGTVAIGAFLHGPVIQVRLGLDCRSLQSIAPDSPPCPPTFGESLIAALAWAVVTNVAFLLVVGARSLVSHRPPARSLALASQALIVVAITVLAVSYVIVFVANWDSHFGRLLPLVERALN